MSIKFYDSGNIALIYVSLSGILFYFLHWVYDSPDVVILVIPSLTKYRMILMCMSFTSSNHLLL